MLALLGLIGHLPATARADVRLPQLVGNHMVLQRDKKLKIWGWADPGDRISVDFEGHEATTRADRAGRWAVSLGPLKGGGRYRMNMTGNNKIHLVDVLVGDVWVAAGQSNMEFPLKRDKDDFGGVLNSDQELADTSYPAIRLSKVDHAARFQATRFVSSLPILVRDWS